MFSCRSKAIAHTTTSITCKLRRTSRNWSKRPGHRLVGRISGRLKPSGGVEKKNAIEKCNGQTELGDLRLLAMLLAASFIAPVSSFIDESHNIVKCHWCASDLTFTFWLLLFPIRPYAFSDILVLRSNFDY